MRPRNGESSNLSYVFKTSQVSSTLLSHVPPLCAFFSFAPSAFSFRRVEGRESEQIAHNRRVPVFEECSFLSVIRAVVRRIRWHPTILRGHERCLEPER